MAKITLSASSYSQFNCFFFQMISYRTQKPVIYLFDTLFIVSYLFHASQSTKSLAMQFQRRQYKYFKWIVSVEGSRCCKLDRFRRQNTINFWLFLVIVIRNYLPRKWDYWKCHTLITVILIIGLCGYVSLLSMQLVNWMESINQVCTKFKSLEKGKMQFCTDFTIKKLCKQHGQTDLKVTWVVSFLRAPTIILGER